MCSDIWVKMPNIKLTYRAKTERQRDMAKPIVEFLHICCERVYAPRVKFQDRLTYKNARAVRKLPVNCKTTASNACYIEK
jgi:hypothetical protein